MSILLIIPCDYYLNEKFSNGSEYRIQGMYFLALFFYFIFVLLSAIFLPLIKNKRIKDEINELAKRNAITFAERKKIQSVLDNVLMCKSFFTIEGLMQFFMGILFSIGVVVCFFAIEGLILSIMQNTSVFIPLIYGFSFLIILIIESLLDDYLVLKIRNKIDKSKQETHTYKYRKNKKLLSIIMSNAGNISSLSENLSALITENAIDDMCEILTIASDTKDIKKNITQDKKKYLKKGKIEKKEGKFLQHTKSRFNTKGKVLKNLHP